jgi:DNA-binding response OmpR family regulator
VVVQRVLVVDDDQDTVDAIATLVRILGHEPRTARDGREALEVAKAFDPTIVLLDVRLPDISGYEVARALRSATQCYIAAVTGFSRPQEIALSMQCCDEHITKPMDLVGLRRILGYRRAS